MPDLLVVIGDICGCRRRRCRLLRQRRQRRRRNMGSGFVFSPSALFTSARDAIPRTHLDQSIPLPPSSYSSVYSTSSLPLAKPHPRPSLPLLRIRSQHRLYPHLYLPRPPARLVNRPVDRTQPRAKDGRPVKGNWGGGGAKETWRLEWRGRGWRVMV